MILPVGISVVRVCHGQYPAPVSKKKKQRQHHTSMSIGNVAQTPVVSGALGPVISVCVQAGLRMAGE